MAAATPSYHCTFTFSGYTGTETLLHFPALIKLAEGVPSGFSYSQFADANAADLSFADANGNKLAYEIDTWDPNGTSFIWVDVPSLTASTAITAYWGDDTVTAPPPEGAKGSVWAGASYAGVWHFGEASGTAVDAANNGLDGTARGADVSQMVADGAGGVIGNARVIASSSVVNYFEVPSYDALALGDTFTASAWVKAQTVTANGRIFKRKPISWDKAGWETQWKSVTQVQARGGDNAQILFTVPTVAQNWRLLSFVYDSTNINVYADGTYIGSQPTVAAIDTGTSLFLNHEKAFVGSFDEFRLQDGVQSADWVAADYATVKNPDFYEAGVVIDDSAFNMFKVVGSAGVESDMVSPAFGKHPVTDGETVSFSAPVAAIRLSDGNYVTYSGYRLYVVDANMQEELVEDSPSLSGSYTHVAGTSARVEWKQTVRRGGVSFPTRYVSVVTVPGYTGSETLYNFPVAVRITQGYPAGFSYSAVNAGGTDILFTDAAGNVIPHEIEVWDPNGTSLIWVNLPELTSNTRFRFCYGNADITTPQTVKGDVWTDANYAGVWHMSETDGGNAVDATVHGLDGVPTGAATNEMVAAEGIAGGARTVAQTAVVNSFAVPSYDSLGLGDTFTASIWVKAEQKINSNTRIFCRKGSWSDSNGWETQWNTPTTTGAVVTPRGASGSGNGVGQKNVPSPLSSWVHLAFVYNGDTVTTYANGVSVGDNEIAAATDNGRVLYFGGSAAFRGYFDEVRLMPGAASAARVKAEYDTTGFESFVWLDAVTENVVTADSFTVESSSGPRGSVTPSWGGFPGSLTEGQVINFSAPEGVFDGTDGSRYYFSGYALYVTGADGIERLSVSSEALSGSYTHVAGQSVRLVWNVVDLFAVNVVADNGTSSGEGYYTAGTSVTIEVVPDEGYRFKYWMVGDVIQQEPSTTLHFTVTGSATITAILEELPHAVGFWTFKDTLMNEANPSLFPAVAYPLEFGVTPTLSTAHPGVVVYADSSMTNVAAVNPGSVYFHPAPGYLPNQGGGTVEFGGLGTWLAEQGASTVECFFKLELPPPLEAPLQYSALWSVDLGNDPAMVFAPGGAEGDLWFSCETAKANHKGNITFSPVSGRLSEAWHHVAVVFDKVAQKARLFVDYKETTGSKDVSINSALGIKDAFYLGSALSNGKVTQNLCGYVSCLRVTKGSLGVDDFMRARAYTAEQADDTVAFYNTRGTAGQNVGVFNAVIGDAELAAVGTVEGGDAAYPVWSDDVPDEVIYPSTEAIETMEVICKQGRYNSITFTNTDTKTGSYVVFENLSEVISSLDAFTVEFFAKNEGGQTWKTAMAMNIAGVAWNGTPLKVAIPGSALTKITFQNPGQYDYNLATSLVDDHSWHHIAIEYDPADGKLHYYVDYLQRGVQTVERKESFAPVIWGGYFSTGTNSGRRKESFVGKLCCLRVTGRVLSPEEFLQPGKNPARPMLFIIR